MARRRPRLAGSPAIPFRRVAARLAPGEEMAGERRAAARFPVRWTGHYLALAAPGDPHDPIRRIAWPDPRELEGHPVDLPDPVGEATRSPVPFVVRKHRDRLVFLVSSTCHVYCRFCFRRAFPDGAHREPAPADVERALAYVAGESDVREVILSGGDPLTLPDAALHDLVRRLSAIPHLTRLRLHTRAPVHDPDRITPELASGLAAGLPMRVVTHYDHPRELGDATLRVADTFAAAGIPVSNQSVLLAGVNDDAEVLADLCTGLHDRGIEPYYLHHPDRVPGAGSFWVDYDRGLAIHAALRDRLPGHVPLPAYVVDLPDGSGKIPVAEAAARGRLPRVPTRRA